MSDLIAGNESCVIMTLVKFSLVMASFRLFLTSSSLCECLKKKENASDELKDRQKEAKHLP